MNRIQTSETARLGAILAIAGGFMDAYSYLCRGKVFANAQTGNMLLLGVNLFGGDWAAAARYGAPIVAFSLGIVLAEGMRGRNSRQNGKSLLHWRQASLLLEILFLVVTCLIPQRLNLLANSLTSLACGIQVESFRKIRGNGIATTMCIGNLRSGTENLCRFSRCRDRVFLRRALLYYGIIVCFILGAVLGNWMIGLLAERALLVCAGILLLAFLLMFAEKRQE
ncbi:MAG: YoaK family protein [Oscillospiraceae bacterium]|nr:YoaK family protein [Oscillospiraceae bacterium]